MNLELGAKVTVECIKILEKGIVVKLEDSSTEFIHISNISSLFVRNITDFVNVGEKYEAICIAGRARPIELSLIHEGQTAPTVVEHASKTFQKTPAKPVYREQTTVQEKKETAPLSFDQMLQKSNNALRDKFQNRDRDGRRNSGRRGKR